MNRERIGFLMGGIFFIFLFVALVGWFALQVYNYSSMLPPAYGCGDQGGSKEGKAMPSQTYKGGMMGYTMYVQTNMFPLRGSTHQEGTLAVAFCGFNTPIQCFEAPYVSVQYHTDTCTLDFPLDNSCIQESFAKAFPGLASLQRIVYDGPNDEFHIQALGVGVLKENVVLKPTTDPICGACASQKPILCT